MQNYTGPSDVVLMHYGVKGMKWGVRKADGGSQTRRSAKKQLKSERDSAKKKAMQRMTDAENASSKAYDSAYKKARSAGKSRLQAHKEAGNDKTFKELSRNESRAESAQISATKKADQNYKSGLKSDKQSRKQARAEMEAKSLKHIKETNTGKLAADMALLGTARLGYHEARGSGATKGQATVAYLLAGSNAGKAYRKFATR